MVGHIIRVCVSNCRFDSTPYGTSTSIHITQGCRSPPLGSDHNSLYTEKTKMYVFNYVLLCYSKFVSDLKVFVLIFLSELPDSFNKLAMENH